MALPLFRCVSSPFLSPVAFSRWVSLTCYHARPPVILSVATPRSFALDDPNGKDPAWRRSPLWRRKQFGRKGEASGVDVAELWPSRDQLSRIIQEEGELYPSLEEIVSADRERLADLEEQRKARRRHIVECMAGMDQAVVKWKKAKKELRATARAAEARKKRILEQAQERLGYNVDQRSADFLLMVQEIDKEERKQVKEDKKQKRVLARERARSQAKVPAVVPDESSGDVLGESSGEVPGEASFR
uniref:large ribosomal subunit protein mL64 n=1 Tax=Myxine glutinosa TaxID=7769 RepID=UPI00358EB1D7